MKTKYKNKNKKKIFLLVTLMLVFASVLFIIYIKPGKSDDKTEGVQTIKYKPATKEEKTQAEENKDRIITEQNSNVTESSSSKFIVKPVITNTTGTVNAYIPNIFEEGGTCTAVFTNATNTLSKSSTGFQNVSYTQCAPITLEPSFLSPGKWKILVKYVSDKSEGSSDTQAIEVR